MARGTNVVLASAARTTSGVSSGFAQNNSDWAGVAEKAGEISVLLDVTAVSGTTATLTLAVEWSYDNTTWFTADPADTMTVVNQADVPESRVKNFVVKGQYFRVAYTLGGTTPNFTFSVRSQGWEG